MLSVAIVLLLSYNSISVIGGAYRQLQTKEDVIELVKENKSTLVGINGTQNKLFTFINEDHTYFSLQEFGFDVIIKIRGTSLDNLGNLFTGPSLPLAATSNKDTILRHLNSPILEENLNIGLTLSDEQKKEIIEKTKGEFTENTLLISAYTIDNLTTGLVIVENVTAGLIIFAGLTLLLKGIVIKRTNYN